MEHMPLRAAHAESPHQKKERLQNQIFDQLVASHVLEKFHDDIDEADIPESDYEQIVSAFADLSEENKRAVLAIPAQLRPQTFRKYAALIHEGKMTGAGVVLDILEKAKKYGFTVGFHLSPYDIRPNKDGSWYIKGTEPDHRHDDLPMAYYSADYTHRYLKKPANYLYVIRAETGENSSHYRDNDESWGHASSLSVVDKIDMRTLENEMQKRYLEMTREETKKGDVP